MKKKMSLGAVKERGMRFPSLERANFFVVLGKGQPKRVPSPAMVPVRLSY